MENNFSMIRRRTSDLLQDAKGNMPSKLPQLPQMPQISSLSLGGKEPGMKGTWERIPLPPIDRSSHSINVISGAAYIFGGEINPREPVDNAMQVVKLPYSMAGADHYAIAAKAAAPDEARQSPATELQPEPEPEPDFQTPAEEPTQGDLDTVDLKDEASPTEKSKEKQPATYASQAGNVPEARVGHAAASVGSRIFLFGGRGGPEMKPLEEAGRVWVFDTRTNTWTYLDPVPAVKGGTIVPHPAARSYHCATATDKPREFAKPTPKPPQNWRQRLVGDTSKTGIPQDPIVGNVAENATDLESDGYGTFIVHGGCLANGERTNDMWAFDVRTRTWTELPAAPGPARGGTAICISKSRLFRFGGFDGQNEIGGQLDFIHLEVEAFDDKANKGEVAVHARGTWQSIIQNNLDASSEDIPIEPAHQWPAARSVMSFHALTIGGGREYLVLAFGEGSPSSEGHAGAGKFHSDVWTFQVPPLGMTPASFTSAMLQAVGRKTGEGKWLRVTTSPFDEDNADEPESRGWQASAVMTDLEESAIVIWGGLSEENKRLGDGWILRLG
ncbi:Epithiospecifier protein-like protein [Emericellopsis cladophorae]|uniref:Epithiospecifier protein-like protein n=1 Tax=Emericellopsis cladophorae TaxID=2686198 RepID=A0A9P9Y7B7_9HYPO|nr:Epithiospecifier protein-like protein [Emericellopsis cladophorae]KAI6784214.1 Epithiospecifier protein-like protein [Emericellopsis cladophorae]